MPTTESVISERRRRIVAWVGASIMPHEAKVRAWLYRAKVSADEVDDLIQEAYCKLAALSAVDHILRPDAYFFALTRNLLRKRLSQSAVVSIAALAEIESIDDERPSPEREVEARQEYERVRALIDALPERSRRILEMRKFLGMSQREIASEMGISEGMVEYHVYQGVKALARAMQRQDADTALRLDQFQPEKV